MTPTTPLSPLGLLRSNTPYRRLYTARLVSLLGDWFNLLALVVLLREIGGDGAMALGGTLILKSLPPLLATPISGWVADRFPRKTIMIASDVGRAVVVLGMLGQLVYPSLPILMMLVALQAFIGAFFEPARRAITPSVVPPEDLETAGALDAATWSAMLALGAALGGLTTAWLGWEAALLVDAATYVVSVLFLLGVPRIQVAQRQGSGTLREGAAYLRANPRVWTLALVKMGWSVAGATTLVLALLGEGPLHADKDPIFSRLAAGAQDASVIGVTVLFVARGLGTAVGPFVARWLSKGQAKRMEWLIGISFAWGAIFYVGVGLMPTLSWAVPFVAVAHLGGATAWVFSTVRLQQLVPDAFMGRVFAAELGAFTAMFAASTAVYSALSDGGWGPQRLVAIMGLGLLLPAGLWVIRQAWVDRVSPLLDPKLESPTS
ncbi:MAG: hypothetical protein ACI9VR_001113 [Cognaticolwellia sp.]